jgi:mannose-1-phosphate guanylyltransferase
MKTPFDGERVEKPWGHEVIWAKGKDYVGKIIHINPGQSLSLQYHKVKEETIICLEGIATIRGDKKSIQLKPGMTHHVFPGDTHQFANYTHSDVVLMEVSSNHLDDVVRIKDRYNRI